MNGFNLLKKKCWRLIYWPSVSGNKKDDEKLNIFFVNKCFARKEVIKHPAHVCLDEAHIFNGHVCNLKLEMRNVV